MNDVFFFCDGACNPNPGNMGIGVAMVVAGDVVATISEQRGEGTSNIAEYLAVEAALNLSHERGVRSPQLRTDSQLIVQQLLGKYAVQHPDLIPLSRRVRAKLEAFGATLEWVPREQNTHADRLSKRALKPLLLDDPAGVVAQAQTALAHLSGEELLREITLLAIDHATDRPDLLHDALLDLRIGRSAHSNDTEEVARFYARTIHGKQPVEEMEVSLSDRSPATRLKALRWAARGLAPALVAAKLTLEKAATLPYRQRNQGAAIQ